MSRLLLPALALSLAAPATAIAQACLGNASFATNHLQVNGSYSGTADVDELDASFVWGSNSAFAGLGVGSTEFDGGTPTTRVSGSLGYQVPVSASGRVQACPLLRASYGFPTDIAGGGEFSTQGYALGVAIGGTLMSGPRMALVPSVQAGVQRDVFTVSGGLLPNDRSDTYATVGVALGFVLNNALSLRPQVSLPINAASDDPIYGFGLSLNFGGRR